jgi:hypothetical protein
VFMPLHWRVRTRTRRSAGARGTVISNARGTSQNINRMESFCQAGPRGIWTDFQSDWKAKRLMWI